MPRLANRLPLTLLVLAAVAAGCGGPQEPIELRHLAADGADGLVASGQVLFDADVSSDGGGSLRIDAKLPGSVPLYELADVDVDGATLTYRARIKTQDVRGKVYLEMWCQFAEEGAFFSRGLDSAVTGTSDWTVHETPFFLQPGQNPDAVSLRIVIEGAGTVWVDDIDLLQGPLPQ